MSTEIQSQTQQFSIQALIFVIILLLYLLTSHLTDQKQATSGRRYLRYFHESTLAILMGVLTALFAKYGIGREVVFSDQLFFDIVMPMVIFSAGYGARKSKMFENWVAIGVVGIFGTLIGFLLLAVFIGVINAYLFQILTLKEVLLLSSVLCATDTVAAMSLIKVKKFPALSSIVFGQSIINNSVSIILFHTISKSLPDIPQPQHSLTFWRSLIIFINFVYLFAFSVAFGIMTGLALSLLFKKCESFVKKPIRQVGLILLNGYFTYLLGELLGLSGVIALFTCAGVMGRYTYENVSMEAKKGTELAFETVSYLAQAFIFAYLGASILAVEGQWSAIFMAAIILISLPTIRALMVILLPLSHLFLKQKQPLTLNQLKILWFNGIIRGAVAFALSLQVGSKDKKYLITVSLVIVMVTSILGSTLLRKFKQIIGLKVTHQETSQQLSFIATDRASLTNMPKLSLQKNIEIVAPAGSLASRLSEFEETYIKPKFVRANKKISYNLEKSGEQAPQTQKNMYNYNEAEFENQHQHQHQHEHEHQDRNYQQDHKTEQEDGEFGRKGNKVNINFQKNKEMILQI